MPETPRPRPTAGPDAPMSDDLAQRDAPTAPEATQTITALRDRIDARIRQPILWGLEDPCGTERASEWADYILKWVMEEVGPELEQMCKERDEAVKLAEFATDLHRDISSQDQREAEAERDALKSATKKTREAAQRLQEATTPSVAAFWSNELLNAALALGDPTEESTDGA